MANFTISPNAFSKCSPALITNIGRCGTVTQCNAVGITADELDEAFKRGDDFRLNNALFMTNMEIKMCDTQQNGLYDFIMANRKDWTDRRSVNKINRGLLEVAPFIKAKQYSAINDEWWRVEPGGSVSGGYFYCNVQSTANVPADTRYFAVGLRVSITGSGSGGVTTHTNWKIVSATAVTGSSNYVRLQLLDMNGGSNFPADKVGTPTTGGILVLGTPNVNDYEKFCLEQPAIINSKRVPFWVETIRDARCKSSLYDNWRELLLSGETGNALYQQLFDIDEVEINRQLGASWMKRFTHGFFFQSALPYQNLSEYDALEDITTYDGGDLGVDGAKCVGKRANAVGVLEQLAECNRVVDCAGAQLNLPALFAELYNMRRIRQSNQHPNPNVFDLFVDSVTADKINTAMVTYYNSRSGNTMRLVKNIDRDVKTAEFGFMYESYKIFYPQGITINVIWSNYFDDMISAANQVGQADQNRVLWILDMRGIYMAEVASNRKNFTVGDLPTLASISPEFACVMQVPTQQKTLTSVTYTTVVECPAANLILENFNGEIPEAVTQSGSYPSTSSTTTTTPHTTSA